MRFLFGVKGIELSRLYNVVRITYNEVDVGQGIEYSIVIVFVGLDAQGFTAASMLLDYRLASG